MEPLLSMKDCEGLEIPPGSSCIDIFVQVVLVAKRKSTNIKTHMGGSSRSSTPKIKEPNSVAEAGYANTNSEIESVRKRKSPDDNDKGNQFKKQKMASTSGIREPNSSVGKELEVDACYSLGTIKRETSSPRSNSITSSDLGFQEKDGLSTKKKSIDGSDDNKDLGLKPKLKNMKSKKKHGRGSKRPNEIRAPRYSTDPKDLPEELKRKIENLEGIESFEKAKMILVIEKKLYLSDLKDGANRLSMPLKQIKPASFLDEDEIEFLANQGNRPVLVIDPQLDDVELTFRQWNMEKDNGNVSSTYVFKTRWKEVYKKNGLQIDDVVQVWSFRDVGNKLHFALVLLEKAKKGGSGSDGNGCSQPFSRSTTPPSKSDVVNGDIGQGAQAKEEGVMRGGEIYDGSGRSSTPCSNSSKSSEVVDGESSSDIGQVTETKEEGMIGGGISLIGKLGSINHPNSSILSLREVEKDNEIEKEITAPRYSTDDPNDLPEELKRKIGTMEGIESFEKAKMIMVIV
ncbi:hypothetical protein M0R45_038269 [Rubus argutus]|uniref:TF-B3 domain-containing protein n=1 Tax=Rubus argutus TaxID=59490 RepID=A0AAW1W568_RUBAR